MDLANVTELQALALDRSNFAAGSVLLLWQCAKCQFEYPVGRVTKRFHSDPGAIPEIIKRTKAKELNRTETFFYTV